MIQSQNTNGHKPLDPLIVLTWQLKLLQSNCQNVPYTSMLFLVISTGQFDCNLRLLTIAMDDLRLDGKPGQVMCGNRLAIEYEKSFQKSLQASRRSYCSA